MTTNELGTIVTDHAKGIQALQNIFNSPLPISLVVVLLSGTASG